ncbi:MAG: hypothetical protein EOO88_32235, partial [Pedobacter sp.]
VMYSHFAHWDLSKINEKTLFDHMLQVGSDILWMIMPIFLVTTVTAMFITFSQTRLNWSWKRLAPKWERLNFFTGLVRMVSMDALVEVIKSVGKMTVIFAICYLILKGEFREAFSFNCLREENISDVLFITSNAYFLAFVILPENSFVLSFSDFSWQKAKEDRSIPHNNKQYFIYLL